MLKFADGASSLAQVRNVLVVLAEVPHNLLMELKSQSSDVTAEPFGRTQKLKAEVVLEMDVHKLLLAEGTGWKVSLRVGPQRNEQEFFQVGDRGAAVIDHVDRQLNSLNLVESLYSLHQFTYVVIVAKIKQQLDVEEVDVFCAPSSTCVKPCPPNCQSRAWDSLLEPVKKVAFEGVVRGQLHIYGIDYCNVIFNFSVHLFKSIKNLKCCRLSNVVILEHLEG